MWSVNVAKNKVISKECANSVNRLIAASDSLMSEEYETIRPQIIRSLLNDGGSKNFNTFQGLATWWTNSLLASGKMLFANVLSGANMLTFFTLNDIATGTARKVYGTNKARKLKSISDTVMTYAVLAGDNGKVLTNMARYFSAGMKTGKPADIGADVQYLAARQGITPKELKRRAKEEYVKAWSESDPNGTLSKEQIDAFVDSIELSDEEVVKFFTDYEYAQNILSIPKGLKWMTIPQRSAVAIDESTKSFFRTYKLSRLARDKAIKDGKGNADKINELHRAYFKEAMDVHESTYQGEYALAKMQETNASFRGVRSAVKALEEKSDELFQDIFPAEDIPYESIREFALNNTFQRRLPAGQTTGPMPKLLNALSRAKQKVGSDYTIPQNIGALASTVVFPFAITPYNIKMEALSYIPIVANFGFMRPKVVKKKRVLDSQGRPTEKTYTKLEGEDYEDWKTRIAIGTSVLGSIGTMFYMSDDKNRPILTGKAVDANERRQWEAAGIPEQSILVGNTYVPYSRIEPIGTLLSYYVDSLEAIDRYVKTDKSDPESEALENLIDELAFSMFSSLMNTPLLDGTIKWLDYYQYGFSKGIENSVSVIGKGAVPTFLSDLARMLDDEERIALDVPEKIQQRVPILREQLPADKARMSVYDSPNVTELLLGLNFVPVNNTDVAKYIYRTDAKIPSVKPLLRGVKLNSTEYSVYKNIHNEIQNNALNITVNRDSFVIADLPIQRLMLQEAATVPLKFREAEFLKGMQKELGPMAYQAWVKNWTARVRNQQVRRKGLGEIVGFEEVE